MVKDKMFYFLLKQDEILILTISIQHSFGSSKKGKKSRNRIRSIHFGSRSKITSIGSYLHRLLPENSKRATGVNE